jgi:cell division protein ZapA (FtsZ GTPase activity inhibitor)
MNPQLEHTISLHIMERDFLLSCKPEEQAKTHEAAALLEEKMVALKTAGHITGVERIAILAGLQLAVELLDLQAAKPLIDPEWLRAKIDHIENTVQQVL